jgi:hypothetical protein
MRLFVFAVMFFLAMGAKAADGVIGDWLSPNHSVVRVYETRSGGGLLLLRQSAPLTRRTVA